MSSTKDSTGAITKYLQNIRAKIKSLDIPTSVYAGLGAKGGDIHIAETGAEKMVAHQHEGALKKGGDFVFEWLSKHANKNKFKFIGAAISDGENLEELASRLWLGNDIVPFIVKEGESSAEEMAGFAASKFVDGVPKIEIGEDRRVETSFLVSLNEYKKITPEAEFKRLKKLASDFEGKKISFFSATPRGGGVALMRHALIRLFRLLGVNASWHVLQERKEVFEITKTKFHNVLHGIGDPRVKLTDEDRKIYRSWIEENRDNLKELFKTTDVIVIDDPQPSGLVPYIREINPEAKIIYRSHIELQTELIGEKDSPQELVWNYIWESIKDADLFISHPVENFIPDSVPKEKVILMPATTDPLDGLNKPLSKKQREYYLKLFNKHLLENGQQPLDDKKPTIVQIARFDPSKGISDVLESFSKLRKLFEGKGPKPQLVIAGNASIDDPDGIPIYNLTHELIEKKYKKLSNDIKIAKLPHIDPIMNTILREAKIALQLSEREGFEVKVTEALMKRVPVIAYKAGGIPLQIHDGVSGHLVEIGDTEAVAELTYELLTDKNKYKEMAALARASVHPDVNTVSNAINWLFLGNKLLTKGKIKGQGKYIKELIGDYS